MSETSHHSGEQSLNPEGTQWVTELYQDRGLDSVSETNVAEVISLAIEGVDRTELKKLVEAKDAKDPNVFLKNRLLAKLAELAEDPKNYTSDFLALLEHQAQTLDDQPEETRYRQFMGILDIVVTCFEDQEVHDLFEERKESLRSTMGPTGKPPEKGG